MMAQRAAELREIRASDWQRQRFGWLESLRRDGDLSPMARLVGHVLALDFANRETGRCDPPLWEIARVLGTSPDTVKRAIRALVEGGWIAAKSGRGRGLNSHYTFLTRAVVVPIKGGKSASRKGGSDASFYNAEKGAEMPPDSSPEKGADLLGKGGKSAPPVYNIDKPCLNHGAQAGARASENPMVQRAAERAVSAFRNGRTDAFNHEPVWVRQHIIAANLLTPDERQAAQGLEGERK